MLAIYKVVQFAHIAVEVKRVIHYKEVVLVVDSEETKLGHFKSGRIKVKRVQDSAEVV